MTKNKRPYAVFDIDGTLIRWQLYHALADMLVKKGHIDSSSYQSILKARNSWKTRDSSNSFYIYEQCLVDMFDSAVNGISYDDFMAACDDVINRYKNQVYTYTRDLIKNLKQKDYLLFAISASPAELVEQIATHYGFDGFGATKFLTNNGCISGVGYLAHGNNKVEILENLIEKNNASSKGSIAIGDTEGDIPLLSCSERAIAFNPNRELYKHASKEGWDIVVERKNMTYQLQYEYGRYILAPPNKRQASV